MSESLVFPIFPLDQVVLVPGFYLPLHVFEPRYLQMVADALAGPRLIAMAMPLVGHSTQFESRPPVHPVCGLGRIVRHDALPDRRLNILLEGVARMRVDAELETAKLYRLVRASEFPDVYPEDDDDLDRRIDALVTAARGLDADDRARLLAMDPGRTVDALVLGLPVEAVEKHRLLAISHVAKRAAELEAVLRKLSEPGGLYDAPPGDPRLN